MGCLFFVLLLVIHLALAAYHTDEYLAICAVGKFEVDIVEWVEYHYRLGVQKFYIFDNSPREYLQMLKDVHPYIMRRVVQYARISNQTLAQPQKLAYHTCHKYYRHKHQFMAFIDMDEFVVVTQPTLSLATLLRRYEPYGALALTWMMFSSSGRLSKPPGGVIQHYFKCYRATHVKLIVNMQRFKSGKFLNPHEAVLDKGYPAVTEKFLPVTTFQTRKGENSFDLVYLNHYVTKSAEDFANKNARGAGWAADKKGKRWSFFEDEVRRANLTCPVLQMPAPNSRQ
eukprot:gene29960-36184_t